MKKQSNNYLIIRLSLFLLLIGVILLNGCITSTDIDNEKVSVVATIIPQQEMIQAIGGDYVDVTIMVPAGESPHSYEPIPRKMFGIAEASAYFKVGSGVEFEVTYLETIKEQNSDLKLFDCSQNISVLSFDEHYGKKEYKDSHYESHSHNVDSSPGTDPHIWTSPLNYKIMAENVYNGLVEIDPNHQQIYSENYENYSKELDELHESISTMLKPYEGKSFMVYHPSWGYFSDTYKLKQIAIEEEGKQPGIQGVEAIITQARNENISVIIVSPQFDRSNAETIAVEINGEVISVNPLMTNYIETLQLLAETIIRGYASP